MTPERWQQIKELFNSALEREADQRASFVAQACSGDEELRKEVHSLLSSHERDGGFIDAPAFEFAAELLIKNQSTMTSGQTIGSYRILSILGRGGMGEVYLAEDSRLGRKVALKFLPSSLAGDTDRLRRFELEARTASALNHPNILTIYEIGSDGGRQFIAAEYVEGETLRQRMVHSRLSVLDALEIAIQVASALAAAHQAPIVHRDIKPENIMLRNDGYVKVVDFGLAKLTHTAGIGVDTSIPTALRIDTETGTVMGTTAYMSPEQARALPLDARADVWSLGVVLYEMITTRVPFEGETSSHVIVSILEREPTSIALLVADVPPEIEWVIKKALRKDRDERYQTVNELLGDLRNLKRRLEFQAEVESTALPEVSNSPPSIQTIAKSESSSSPPVTDVYQTRPTNEGSLTQKIKHNKWALVLAAFVLVAIVIAGSWKFFRPQRNNTLPPRSDLSSDKLPELKAVQLTSWSGLDLFPAFSPDGNSIAYSSDHNGTFEIYIKQLAPGGREIQLTSDGQQNFEPEWSPDGKLIAFHSSSRGGIWVVAAFGGVARQLTDFGSYPRWSPDGSALVFQSTALRELSLNAPAAMPPSTIWIIPAAGGSPHQLTQTGNPVGGHGSPSWSPNGERIVFAASIGNTGGIWSVASNGSELHNISNRNGFSPVYSSDGTGVYFAGGDPVGDSWALLSSRVSPQSGESLGEATVLRNTGSTFFKYLRVSPDGKKIACSALQLENNLSAISIAPGSRDSKMAPVVLTQDTNYRKYAPAFSPDGSKIAFSVVRIGSNDEVWIMDADGKNPTLVHTNPGAGSGWASWFPEGNRLAYSSFREHHLRAIDLQTGRDQLLIESDQRMGWAKLSPDGKQFAFNSTSSGTINVWTIPVNGGQARQLTFDNELMGFPSWSPDGSLIAFEVKRGDDAHVAIIPSDGGTPVQLTSAPGQDFVHSWSPDGSKVAFAGQRDGVWNIYWVSIKDKTERKLTDYAKLHAYVRYPSWSPLGDKIVYEYAETTGNIWLMELK